MEDVSFSLGLGSDGFVVSLNQTEASAAEVLDRLGDRFDALKKRIEDAGSGSGLAKLFDSLKVSSGELNENLKDTRVLLAALKGEARQKTEIDIDASKSLAGVRQLNTAVSNLKRNASTPAQSPQTITLFGPNGQPLPSSTSAVTPTRSPVGGGGGGRAGSGGSNVRVSAQQAGNAFDSLRARQETFNQVFQRSAGILRNVSTVLSTIGIGGGIFALIYGFKSLVQDGIDFNSQLEQARVSIGAIVNATAEKITLDGQELHGLAAVEAVQGNVAETINKLKADALLTNGTFADLQKIFTSISPVVFRLGGSLGDAEKLTRATAVAASAMGVGFDEAALGVVELLNKTARVTNPLIQRLPGQGIEQLRKDLENSATRVDTLYEKLNKLAPAGELIQHTFKGAFASLQDFTQQFTGKALEPVTNRLTSGFNTTLSALGSKNEKGSFEFAPGVEEEVVRVQTLIDGLTRKATAELKDLFNVGKEGTFLDALERDLPRIEDDIFVVLRAFKSLGGFLEEHGQQVLTLLTYYALFRGVQGIFFSLGGAITNLGGSVLALGGYLVDLVRGLNQTAVVTVQTEKQFLASQAAAESFSLSLKSIAAGTGLAAVVIGTIAIIEHFVDASKEAAQFRSALDDLNSLKFDTLITHLDEVIRKVKASQPGFLEDFTHASEATVTKAASQGAQSVDAARIAAAKALQAAGLSGNNLTSGAGIGQSIQDARKSKIFTDQLITDGKLTQAQGAEQKAKQQAAVDAVGEYLNVLDRAKSLAQQIKPVKQRLENEVSVVQGDNPEGNTYKRQIDTTPLDLLSPLFNQTGIAREYADSSAIRAKITPAKVKPEAEKGIEKAQDQQRAKAVELIRESATEQLALLDKGATTSNDLLKSRLADRLLDAKKEAEQELEVTRVLTVSKENVLRQETARLLKVFNERSGVGKILRDTFGITDFNSLVAQKPGQIAENAFAFQQKTANEPNKKKVEINAAALDAAKKLQEVQQKVNTDQEALEQKTLKTRTDITKADQEAAAVIGRTTEEIRDRAAKSDAEAAAQTHIGTSLDARLAKEREISALVLARKIEDIDKKTLSESEKLIKDPNLTQAQAIDLQLQIEEQATAEKGVATTAQQIDLTSKLAAIRDHALNAQRAQLTIDQDSLEVLKTRLGSENVLVTILENKLNKDKADLAFKEAENQKELATQLRATGDNVGAQDASHQADILIAAGNKLLAAQKNYLETVAGGLSQLAGGLGSAGASGGLIGRASSIIGSAGGVAKSVGNLQNIDFGQVYSAAGGGVSGALAAAGPIVEAAGASLNLFKNFFDLLNAGFYKLLQQAQISLQNTINATLAQLKTGQSGPNSTIASLQATKDNITNLIPKPRGGAFDSILGFFGLSSAQSDYKKAILDAQNQIQQQIDALKQQAKDTKFTLENITLPELRVPAGERQYEDQLIAIQKELKVLGDTEGITQQDLADLFSVRTADLMRTTLQQVNQEKQNYINYLLQEQDITLQIAAAENEHAKSELSYQNQRAALLGETVRQLTKQQQLAQLDKDHAISQQQYTQQQADLANRLSVATNEVALYQQQFGIVKDIKQYELEVNAQILKQQSDGLLGLLDFYHQLQGVIAGTVADLLKLTPPSTTGVSTSPATGGGTTPTTGGGGTDPTLNGIANGDTGASVTNVYSFDNMTVGQNLTQSQVRDQVKVALNDVNFQIKQRIPR